MGDPDVHSEIGSQGTRHRSISEANTHRRQQLPAMLDVVGLVNSEEKAHLSIPLKEHALGGALEAAKSWTIFDKIPRENQCH